MVLTIVNGDFMVISWRFKVFHWFCGCGKDGNSNGLKGGENRNRKPRGLTKYRGCHHPIVPSSNSGLYPATKYVHEGTSVRMGFEGGISVVSKDICIDDVVPLTICVCIYIYKRVYISDILLERFQIHPYSKYNWDMKSTWYDSRVCLVVEYRMKMTMKHRCRGTLFSDTAIFQLYGSEDISCKI